MIKMETNKDKDSRILDLVKALCKDNSSISMGTLFAEIKRQGILTYDKSISEKVKNLETSNKISIKNFRVNLL